MDASYSKVLVTLRHGMWLCRPDVRKKPSLFPKFWCPTCKRYVLPDRIHSPVFAPGNTKEEFVNSLQQTNVAEPPEISCATCNSPGALSEGTRCNECNTFSEWRN